MTYKIVRLRWWNLPIRLVSLENGTHRHVGWVYNQRVKLFNSVSQGWIAYLDDQEGITHWYCNNCGHPMHKDVITQIEKELAK